MRGGKRDGAGRKKNTNIIRMPKGRKPKANESLLKQAQSRIDDNVLDAIDTAKEIMQNPDSKDIVRLKAAELFIRSRIPKVAKIEVEDETVDKKTLEEIEQMTPEELRKYKDKRHEGWTKKAD